MLEHPVNHGDLGNEIGWIIPRHTPAMPTRNQTSSTGGQIRRPETARMPAEETLPLPQIGTVAVGTSDASRQRIVRP